jgi:WD40 repeat protein
LFFDGIYYDTFFLFGEHTSLIRDIFITEDDRHVLSTDDNGFVYVIDAENLESNHGKDWDHKDSVLFNQILYDKEEDLFFGCGVEKNMVLYTKKLKKKIADFFVDEWDATAAVLSKKNKVLFMGTSKGTVRIFLWPISEAQLELEPVGNSYENFKRKYPEFIEYQVHLHPISKIAISPDENYLFTASLDGSIFIFKVL